MTTIKELEEKMGWGQEATVKPQKEEQLPLPDDEESAG